MNKEAAKKPAAVAVEVVTLYALDADGKMKSIGKANAEQMKAIKKLIK